jgi:hypothetical protein
VVEPNQVISRKKSGHTQEKGIQVLDLWRGEDYIDGLRAVEGCKASSIF